MVRLIVSIIVFAFTFSACTNSAGDGATVESSGHADLDQTARYARYTIDKVKKRGGMDTPSKVLGYMLSIQGSAALTPPNPELEPGLAGVYKGPRPADTVGLYGDRKEMLPREIILEADDEKNIVVARAYDNESGDLLHSWEWEF